MFTLVTSNEGKAKQIERVLGVPITHSGLDLTEVQTLDIKEVVEAKAREAFRILNASVVVDDTGVYIDELNGLPGTFAKWFEIAIGLEGVCRLADPFPGRKGKVVCALVYFDGTEFASFVGETTGSIAEHPRGGRGFGFDIIFIPEGSDLTWGEMSVEEQDQSSARRKAVEGLKQYLEGRGIL